MTPTSFAPFECVALIRAGPGPFAPFAPFALADDVRGIFADELVEADR